MFNNFKRRFGEKGKRAAALLAAAALLCGLTGCGKSETGSSAPLSSSSVPQSVALDKPLSSVTDSTSSAHATFSKAIPTIKIMDETITLPIKCKDLKHIRGDSLVMPLENKVGATGLFYDDNRIGQLYIEDYENEDDYSEKNIVCLNIYGTWLEDTDINYIDYMGISFSSSKEDVIKTLGEPDEIRGSEDEYSLYLIYSLDSFKDGSVTFVFRSKRIKTIKISCIAF